MDDKPAIRKGETELPESRIFGNLLGLVTINAVLATHAVLECFGSMVWVI
jgi:hypothetical protein